MLHDRSNQCKARCREVSLVTGVQSNQWMEAFVTQGLRSKKGTLRTAHPVRWKPCSIETWPLDNPVLTGARH